MQDDNHRRGEADGSPLTFPTPGDISALGFGRGMTIFTNVPAKYKENRDLKNSRVWIEHESHR